MHLQPPPSPVSSVQLRLRQGVSVLLVLVFAVTGWAENLDGARHASPASAARWRTIEITGNDSFTADKIKKELFSEPTFLIANHPFEDRKNFPKVVHDLLIKGYQHAGFRDAEVTVTQTSARDPQSPATWSIKILEGPRVLRGDVRLLGTTDINTDRLTERLTKRFPPRDAIVTIVYANDELVTRWVDSKGKKVKFEKPIWDPNKGVPFDNSVAVHGAVTAAFSDLGYSNAFTVERFEVDEAKQRGTLLIDVIQTGEHDLAKSIEIAGLKINRRDQVLAFLGIAAGDPIDRSMLQEISQRLFESGRFEKQLVTFDSKTQTLHIDLEELSGLPGLEKPLNENALTLLKVSRWMSGIGARGDDFEREWTHEGRRVRMIFGARGVFFELIASELADEGVGKGKLRAMVDRHQVLVDHSKLGEKLLVELRDEGQMLFTHRFSASTKPDKFVTSKFTFNGDVPLKRGESPFEFQFLSSPSDWIPLAYHDAVRFDHKGDELIVTHDREQIHVDAKTGRIIQWVTEYGTNHFAAGLLATEREALDASIAAKPVSDVRGEPLSSLMQYLLTEPVIGSIAQCESSSDAGSSQLPDRHLFSATRKLAAGGLFSTLDVVRDWAVHDDDAESFQIPSGLSRKNSTTRIVLEICARLTLLHAHQLFDEETWPLILTREAALVVVGGTEQSGEVLLQLINDEQTGPIGLTSIAWLMKLLRMPPDMIREVAKRAQSRLNPEAFDADFELLTRKIDLDSVSRLREGFQSLTLEERDALAGLGNENWKNAIRRLHEVGHVEHEDISESGFWYLVFHGPMESWLNNQIKQGE